MAQSSSGPSIKDIARISGVSTATVSRVLNHKGGYSAETEQRVLAVLQSHHYIVNQAAKALRESKSTIVGLILPDIENPFYASLAARIERLLYDRGYSLMICSAAERKEKELSGISALIAKHAAGILAISWLDCLPEGFPLEGTPTVCIDRIPPAELGIPCVINNDLEAGRIATEHLIRRGCRSVMLLTQQKDVTQELCRYAGYRAALEQNGIPLDRNLILEREAPGNPTEDYRNLVRNYLTRGGKLPDGIFAVSEEAAVGAIFALREFGLEVPRDTKLVTFDNTLRSELTGPGLTSIDRHVDELSDTAVRTLVQLIDGEQPPAVNTVPFHLVERGSSL